MPSFTKPRKQSSCNSTDEYEPELYILALAKMCKLSFEELNQLTLDDFLDIVEMMTPDGEKEQQGTQQDINRFF